MNCLCHFDGALTYFFLLYSSLFLSAVLSARLSFTLFWSLCLSLGVLSNDTHTRCFVRCRYTYEGPQECSNRFKHTHARSHTSLSLLPLFHFTVITRIHSLDAVWVASHDTLSHQKTEFFWSMQPTFGIGYMETLWLSETLANLGRDSDISDLPKLLVDCLTKKLPDS